MLLARKIDKAPVWANVEEQWSNGDFPFSALSEFKDGRSGGLSVFETSSMKDPVLRRIAAALWLGTEQNDLSQYQFRFIETTQLDEIGVGYKKENGKLVIEALNPLHYDLTGITGPKALEIAKVFTNNLLQISPDEILTQVAIELRKGNVPITKLKDNGVKHFKKREAIICKQIPKRKISKL